MISNIFPISAFLILLYSEPYKNTGMTRDSYIDSFIFVDTETFRDFHILLGLPITAMNIRRCVILRSSKMLTHKVEWLVRPRLRTFWLRGHHTVGLMLSVHC